MKITRAFEFIYHQLAEFPKADCLSYKQEGKWVKFTTEEVVNIGKEVGMGLIAMGLQPGDKVAIVSANRPEWNFIDLGVQQAGLVGVPLYPTISTEDYRYILEHAAVKAVFVGDAAIHGRVSEALQTVQGVEAVFSFDRLPGCRHWSEVRILGQEKGDAAELKRRSDAVGYKDLLTIIYTSGTTGKPKGVMLSHENMVSNTLAVRQRVPLTDGNCRGVSFLPLCHVYERTGVYVYFYTGTSIYYAESVDKLGENLQEVKPHTFNTVPRLLEKVFDKIVGKGNALEGLPKKLFFWALDLGLRYEPNQTEGPWYDLQLWLANKIIFSKWRAALGGNIQYISSGAAALQPRLARVFWSAGVKIVEGYGLTETSPVITASVANHKEIRIGSVGPLIEHVQLKFAEDGEILCKGPNVMMGYYKEPDKTAEVMTDGWFHTGDIGVLLEGKYLKITDRKKEMFKTSGGKYVAPQVIENKLKESPYIEQVAVVGEGKKFPGALIVPLFEALSQVEGLGGMSNRELAASPKVRALIDADIQRTNAGLGNWEQIKQYTLMPEPWSVETGELTPTLKLKRRVLQEKYGKEIAKLYGE